MHKKALWAWCCGAPFSHNAMHRGNGAAAHSRKTVFFVTVRFNWGCGCRNFKILQLATWYLSLPQRSFFFVNSFTETFTFNIYMVIAPLATGYACTLVWRWIVDRAARQEAGTASCGDPLMSATLSQCRMVSQLLNQRPPHHGAMCNAAAPSVRVAQTK